MREGREGGKGLIDGTLLRFGYSSCWGRSLFYGLVERYMRVEMESSQRMVRGSCEDSKKHK